MIKLRQSYDNHVINLMIFWKCPPPWLRNLYQVAKYGKKIEIYLKPRPSRYNWKIFSTVDMTLNFDLDLSKVNGNILAHHAERLCRIGLELSEKS